MRRIWFVVLVITGALMIVPFASADTFSFNVNGNGITGGGILTGNSLGGGLWDITSGAFTINGLSATMISNPNPGNLTDYTAVIASNGWYFRYDDVLSESAPYLDDTGGLLFQLSNGGLIEIWSVNGNNYWNEILDGNWAFDPTQPPWGEDLALDVTATPEPSSLLLLGTGLLALALGTFWRMRHRSGIASSMPRAA